jgi:hypothetical protein
MPEPNETSRETFDWEDSSPPAQKPTPKPKDKQPFLREVPKVPVDTAAIHAVYGKQLLALIKSKGREHGTGILPGMHKDISKLVEKRLRDSFYDTDKFILPRLEHLKNAILRLTSAQREDWKVNGNGIISTSPEKSKKGIPRVELLGAQPAVYTMAAVDAVVSIFVCQGWYHISLHPTSPTVFRVTLTCEWIRWHTM